MSHANAPLTPTGRLRLARCVVVDGWTPTRAAERFGVSLTTARRWVQRCRELGKAGMVDRSSRPHSCPHRTPRRRERRVLGLRVSRRWGPARIAYHLGMHPSTVHKILSRYGCLRLAFTDPATGAPVRATTPRPTRYEHAAPGDLVHVDIKKLGRIPDGGGHKVLGRARGRKNRGGAEPLLPSNEGRQGLPFGTWNRSSRRKTRLGGQPRRSTDPREAPETNSDAVGAAQYRVNRPAFVIPAEVHRAGPDTIASGHAHSQLIAMAAGTPRSIDRESALKVRSRTGPLLRLVPGPADVEVKPRLVHMRRQGR